MILRTLKNQIALSRACLEYDRYVKGDCDLNWTGRSRESLLL